MNAAGRWRQGRRDTSGGEGRRSWDGGASSGEETTAAVTAGTSRNRRVSERIASAAAVVQPRTVHRRQQQGGKVSTGWRCVLDSGARQREKASGSAVWAPGQQARQGTLRWAIPASSRGACGQNDTPAFPGKAVQRFPSTQSITGNGEHDVVNANDMREQTHRLYANDDGGHGDHGGQRGTRWDHRSHGGHGGHGLIATGPPDFRLIQVVGADPTVRHGTGTFETTSYETMSMDDDVRSRGPRFGGHGVDRRRRETLSKLFYAVGKNPFRSEPKSRKTQS